MTIEEFLDTHLPTKNPSPQLCKKAWIGWVTNLYIAASDNAATESEVAAALRAAGYQESEFSSADIFIMSETELGRVDRRFSEKMIKNFRDGRGV